MRKKKKQIIKRKRKDYLQPKPDIVYDSLDVSRFINYIMRKGKKQTARKIVYGAFEEIKKKTKKEPLETFEQALENVSPLLEVKSMRIGGANYQVPKEVEGARQKALAMRWIIQAAKSKKAKSMKKKLADELIAASQNTGDAIKKKENVHKMAEANKAFAHFAK